MSKKTILSVEETIAKLKEKNPKPRRIYNRGELTMLVQSLLSDDDYVTKQTGIKAGVFQTKERYLAAEFKKALTDIMRKLGLNAKEAVDAVETYVVPKSLAGAMIDVTHAADHLYMKEVGKGLKFISNGDVDQTIFFRAVEEKEHRIPTATQKGRASGYTKVRVKKHERLGINTKVNPAFKELRK